MGSQLLLLLNREILRLLWLPVLLLMLGNLMLNHKGCPSKSMAKEDQMPTSLAMTQEWGTTGSSGMRRGTTTGCCTAGTGTMTRRASCRWSTIQLIQRKDFMRRGNMCLSLHIDSRGGMSRVFRI